MWRGSPSASGCCASRGASPGRVCASPRRYMKHKRDDGPEKQEDEAVDVTPVMICVFVVMCCSMLVLLYHFYDQLGAPPPLLPETEAQAPSPPGGAPLLGCGVDGARRRGPWGRSCASHSPCEFRTPPGPSSGGCARPPPHPPHPTPSLTGGPAHSLCDHRHLLPVLVHWSLQLSVTARPEAALRQVQVSPGGTPRRALRPRPGAWA